MSAPEKLGKWEVGETLGEGGFSKVKLGRHEKTGEEVALKILTKKGGDSVNSTERKQVEAEIDAMKRIRHKNVIQMKDFNMDLVYRKDNIILVVLELAAGGELFEYLSFTGAFTENIARSYFHQLIEGLSEAHGQNICHRDLKPENLLLDSQFQLKIADFGFAHSMKSQNLYTECGTTGYMAPEMFNNKSKGYDGKTSDIWACGVILFIMIAGFPPYQKPNGRTDWWFDKLKKRKYSRFWEAHTRTATFSDEARDLINRILTVDPKNRIGLDGVKSHAWYTQKTIPESTLTKTLAKRKKIVDEENRKIKITRQREQEQQGGFGGTCVRGMGEEDEFDTESDELPPGCPPSMILLADEGKEDEGDEEDLGGSGGFGDDDGGMDDGEDTDKKEEVAAPVYAPVKMVFTKFDCNATPQDVMEGFSEILPKLNCTITTKGYNIKASVDTLDGEISFVANVFTHPDDSSLSVAEIQRRKGDSSAYRKFYAQIRNKMDVFAVKKTPTKESVETEGTEGKETVESTES